MVRSYSYQDPVLSFVHVQQVQDLIEGEAFTEAVANETGRPLSKVSRSKIRAIMNCGHDFAPLCIEKSSVSLVQWYLVGLK